MASLPSIPQLPGIPKLPSAGELASVTAPAITPGTFSSGPKDEVATADIYKVTSSATGKNKPITSIQELRTAIDETSLDMTLDAGIVSDFMSKDKSGVSFDKNLLTSRLLGTNSEFKAGFSELTDAMKKGALANTFADKAGKLMCTVNDTQSMVDSANIGSVHALGSFINKYTGSPIFSGQDKGAIAGLLGSVVTTSSNLGVTGSFTAISQTVNDNDILGRITRAVLPIAVANSDTGLLREMATSPAGPLINVFSPGFTQNFSRGFSYRGDRAHTLTGYADIFTAFRGVSADWDTIQRGGDGNFALNLLILMGSSKDFQNLLLTGIKYWTIEMRREGGKQPPVAVDPMCALAAAYSKVTVEQAIHRDFPKVALLSVYDRRLPKQTGVAGQRNKNNGSYIDPRVLKGINAARKLFGF